MRLLIILVLSLLLPLTPILLINRDYKIVINQSSQKKFQDGIDLSEAKIQPASAVSKFAGQEYRSFPDISICLINKTAPLPPGVTISSSSQPVEGLGAISIEVKDLNTSGLTKIYARSGTTTCEVFANQHIKITNNIEVNLLVGQGTINDQTITVGYTNLGESKAEVRIVFDWWQYILGVFLCLLGLGVLITIGRELINFVVKK
jgi:hypothetical protein